MVWRMDVSLLSSCTLFVYFNKKSSNGKEEASMTISNDHELNVVASEERNSIVKDPFGQLMEQVEERCTNETVTVSTSGRREYGWNEKMEGDCLVLSDLYDSAGGGISWGFDSCWKNNCCSCKEVTCNDEGRVTEVDIRGLNGELPNNLWDMTELQVLILVGEGKQNESYPDGSVEDLFNYIARNVAILTYLIGEIPYGEGLEMKDLRTLVLYGSFDAGCIPSFGVIQNTDTLMVVGGFDCDLSSVKLPPEVIQLVLVGSFVGNTPIIPRSAIYVDVVGNFDGELNGECFNSSIIVLSLVGHFEGIIPSSISDLKQLNMLELVGNFEGLIPSSISDLKQLTLLNLAGNFEGIIPSSISDLTQLTGLLLVGNLDGVIPSSISDLEQLTVLDLVGNFEGIIPSSISDLKQLTWLQLVGNFEGIIPSSISDLKQLTTLDLLGNFEGIIPSSISDLKQLTELELGGNLEGVIPSSISDLKQLTLLALVGNFEGIIPSSISDLKQLTLLYLVGNFEGIIPSSISDLKQLTVLQLVGNFEGIIPSSISDLKQLTELDLVGNFEGIIPSSSISDLKQLTELELVGNFEGIIPSSISDLKQLTLLQLVGNFEGTIGFQGSFWNSLKSISIVGQFTGYLAADVFNVPHMETLSICCGLIISESATLNNMTNLRNLDLAGNTIGYVGSAIKQLKNLEVLILDHCNISSLPSLSSLSMLKYVSASYNNISSVGDLFFIPSMEQIDLSHNSISGRFTAFSRSLRHTWPSLLSVSLSHNALTEFVLMEAGSVPILRDLDLSYNRLSGNLSSLMPLVFPSLRSANFHNNSLSGHIPSTFSRFTHMENLDLRKNGKLRRGNIELFGETTTTYRKGRVSWICNDMKIKTAVGYYDIEVDDTFQEYVTCTCDVGFFGMPPSCQECEEVSSVAACPGKGKIYAPQGYWATPPMNQNEKQYPSYVLPCGGAGTSGSRCRPESKNYDKTCSTGYTGRMCSGCESGYFSIGNGCMKCMKGTEGKVLMICGVFLAFVLIIWISFSRTISGSGSVKILVVFLQTLYYIWNTRSVKGSEYISSTTGFLGHLKPPGPSCYIDGWTYEATYATNLVLPMAIMLSIGFIFIIRDIFLKIKNRGTSKWRNRSGTAIVFIIYFTYVGFSSEVVQPIPCERDPGLKERYMTNISDERCDDKLQMISITLLLSVVLGIPSGLLLIYIKKGKPSNKSPLSILLLQYHTRTWMWELVITARRILLIIGFMLIPSNTVYQSFVVFVIVGGSLILQVRYAPFRSRLENIFESLSLLLVIINYGVILQYGSPETNQDSSLSYVLVSVDVLFVFGCILLSSRGFVSTVANTIRKSMKKTAIDDDLKVSLVQM